MKCAYCIVCKVTMNVQVCTMYNRYIPILPLSLSLSINFSQFYFLSLSLSFFLSLSLPISLCLSPNLTVSCIHLWEKRFVSDLTVEDFERLLSGPVPGILYFSFKLCAYIHTLTNDICIQMCIFIYYITQLYVYANRYTDSTHVYILTVFIRTYI